MCQKTAQVTTTLCIQPRLGRSAARAANDGSDQRIVDEIGLKWEITESRLPTVDASHDLDAALRLSGYRPLPSPPTTYKA